MKIINGKLLLSILVTLLFANIHAFEARVVSVQGKTEFQESGSWKPLSVGQKINPGTMISTGFKSTVVLSIGKSTITVKPLSRMTVERLIEKSDKDESGVFLNVGSIRADIKSAENKRVGFTVKSPVATASVRGTSGDIDSLGNLVSTSGVWAITPANSDDQGTSGAVVLVEKGSAVSIEANSGEIVSPQVVNLNNALVLNPVTSSPTLLETRGSVFVETLASSINAETQDMQVAGMEDISVDIVINFLQ